MQSITVQQVLDWGPCGTYTDGLVEDLFAGRKTLTGLDILDLDIPQADKLWVLLRKEFIGELQLDILACTFAGRAADMFEALNSGNNRIRHAIDAKYSWIEGLTSSQALDDIQQKLLEAACAMGRHGILLADAPKSVRATRRLLQLAINLIYRGDAGNAAYTVAVHVASVYGFAVSNEYVSADEMDKQLELIRKALS